MESFSQLNSVDELRDLKLENSDHSKQQTPQDIPIQTSATSSVPPPPPPLPQQNTSAPQAAVPPPPPPPTVEEPNEPVMTVSQDPRFKKYFTMLKVGVLEEAVRIKMKTEGLDPNLISTPNAPAPPPDPINSDDSDDDY